MTEQAIHVDYIARVEGEGALKIKVKDNQITELQLRIFEPPRFFQGFLVGRKFDEVPGIVSRICGICPASHQITSIQALEDALGVEPSQQTKDLRLLLALSQWIQSHTLHIYFLALPDFLGYESAIAMAKDHLPAVERALKLKRLGNDLTALVGGREVHPVTPTIGGFTSIPSRKELQAIGERLQEARADALATIDLVTSLKIPAFERDCEHIALSADDTYAVNSGRLVSTKGLDIPVWQYRNHIKERHIPHSNALHSYVEGRGSFLVGPLARVNLNMDKLSPAARKIAEGTGVFPTLNPFYSILARAIELLHSIDTCLEVIERLDPQPEDIAYTVQAGQGFAITEAPRGVLYHSYRINDQGLVEEADIVSPTAHNVANMEEDLRAFAPSVLDLPLEEATLKCEMVIRNYDPCISCSVHFLRLEIERE
ncbi:Coenzyme F420-reducing hydrogenase, alpha subunit [Thermanaeromonas toyohensis ToBE]|uniref:Coenzyme F420-reducing hydrogenase, alpha subunit n=1 Tax=Thermanaeromonas toyohensis ToBE TaxID=698762 RepID=A0A1W1VZU2_9FIRM|nr:Ni/Fe hydrogenase subunit alpha [Thermanaeromonas toyohensis]SMB98877.1 Coenzyme F420-reducing hydrogenase, alpha subunit [Thermanaeromonas toyohensis ToBE]